jgi:predicted DNA-binding transcriptional regulator AlpA
MLPKLARELLGSAETLEIGSADGNAMNSPSRLIRFRDLKARGIVMNWPTLKRLIDREGFPPGLRLSVQTRAWREDEVERWLETRRLPSPLKN